MIKSLKDMLHFVYSTEYFPLTLTRSVGERKQQASAWCLAEGRWACSVTGVIQRRWTVLSVPKGKGWDEGEARAANRRSNE